MKSYFIALVVVLSGCSGYSVTQNKYEAGGKGYVVYAPKPVLLQICSIDEKGGVKYESQIKYIPDLDRPFRVRTLNRLGSSDTSFTYTDGWMLSAAGNKYTPPESLITKLVEVADAGIGAIPLTQTSSSSATGKTTTTTTHITCKNRICDLNTYLSSETATCRVIDGAEKIVSTTTTGEKSGTPTE